jgi:RNA methyltransferase, TrmH family
MLSKKEVYFIKQLSDKKHRLENNLFVAEGTKLIADLLQTQTKVYKLYYTAKEKNTLIINNANATEIDDASMQRITSLKSIPDSLAVFYQFRVTLPTQATDAQWMLALDNIQDPGNLGTIIRIADWFGLTDIVCNDNTVDCYNTKCIQASMGSISRVQVHYTLLPNWLQTQKVPIYATTLQGKAINRNITLPIGIIVIGNEGNGIHNNIIALSTQQITLPKLGGAESLNAAVAAGIIMGQLFY